MKALQILLIIMFCAAPVLAEQANLLTEIEQIQEKTWYLQRDISTQKSSLEKQQEQLELLASRTDKNQLEQNERLTALIQSTAIQQGETRQAENDLKNLTGALATLGKEVKQQNRTLLEQAGKIGALEGSLQTLRAEFASKQASADQHLAETRRQLIETRSQIDMLDQNASVRIEKISLWGGGAALFLAIVLTISLASRRSSAKRTPPERTQPQKHEM